MKRADIVHQMEQIIYQQLALHPTAYPESVEAYNYKDWEGWSSTPGKGGGVFVHLAGDGQLHGPSTRPSRPRAPVRNPCSSA